MRDKCVSYVPFIVDAEAAGLFEQVWRVHPNLKITWKSPRSPSEEPGKKCGCEINAYLVGLVRDICFSYVPFIADAEAAGLFEQA